MGGPDGSTRTLSPDRHARPLRDVVDENSEPFADAVRFVSGIDRAIDSSHDAYPFAVDALELFDER